MRRRRGGHGNLVCAGLVAIAAAALTGCSGDDLGEGLNTPHPIRADDSVAVTITSTRLGPTWQGDGLEIVLAVQNDTGEPLWLPAGDVVVVADPDNADGVVLVQRIPDQEILDSTDFAQEPSDSSARRLEVGDSELVEELLLPLTDNERWGARGSWSRGAAEQVARVRFCLALVPQDVVAGHGYDVEATHLTYPWRSGWWAEEASLACSESVALAEPVVLEW